MVFCPDSMLARPEMALTKVSLTQLKETLVTVSQICLWKCPDHGCFTQSQRQLAAACRGSGDRILLTPRLLNEGDAAGTSSKSDFILPLRERKNIL